ncbi:Protein of unknown function [Desulfonispora thiosulfatigenes DSM 11270]|uniref:DUF3383 family protein n=1 Tax=Desulfonispora thiosulfatigenes DSM 11270 TaxID=656914 RepID=A0A1W1VPS8_DESTI|nr:DUF3383 family protein [Desulfonispora thiosulfatigenes]SMB95358.1 Protein of unknown function [Desulfonispora thiosulfatigenes DSM 11270]
MKDFVVDIQKITKPISQQGFGIILILGTSKDKPYTEYKDLQEIAKDYGEESKEYKLASRIFGQKEIPKRIAIHSILWDSSTGSPTDLVNELQALIEVNNDWYYLTCTENGDDVIKELANWTDGQIRIYFSTTQNKALVETMQNENATVMYHNDTEAFVSEGLAAIGQAYEPGSVTFKFKTIEGVQASNIATADLNKLHENGGFSYIKKMGVLQTTEGITTSGEYIDVVIGAHFIKATMENEAMKLATSTPKIPYDNTGISMLVSVAEKVLKQAVQKGIILKDENGNGIYEITFSKREDAEFNDVAQRIYNGINWSAKLAGAIHTGKISGVLTY